MDEGNDGVPEYPASPEGVARMEHLPTVEASIRYWEAVRARAIRTRNAALEWTAMSLQASYEQARQVIKTAKPSLPREASPEQEPRPRRSRKPPGSSRDGAAAKP